MVSDIASSFRRAAAAPDGCVIAPLRSFVAPTRAQGRKSSHGDAKDTRWLWHDGEQICRVNPADKEADTAGRAVTVRQNERIKPT